MSSGATAQDSAWKGREQAEENQYIRQREREQLEALRDQAESKKAASDSNTSSGVASTHPMDRDFEGGFGGQEDLEDRYATTSGEH